MISEANDFVVDNGQLLVINCNSKREYTEGTIVLRTTQDLAMKPIIVKMLMLNCRLNPSWILCTLYIEKKN